MQRAVVGSEVRVGPHALHHPQVGKWSASGGLNITELPKRKGMNITDSLANRSLVISTILVGPRTHTHTHTRTHTPTHTHTCL